MITIYQGESLPIQIEIRDDAGDLLDLTGAEVKWRLTPRTATTHVLDIKATIVSPGVVRVLLTAADTRQAPAAYVQEVRVWLPSGLVRTVVDEPITIRRSAFDDV